jgi:hypothetical protein
MKQVFHLREPKADPYQIKNDDSSDYDLILWSIRFYDHILIMPELTLLIQEYYCFN